MIFKYIISTVICGEFLNCFWIIAILIIILLEVPKHSTSVGERQKTRGRLMEGRLNRTRSFYQITSSSFTSQRILLEITRIKTPEGARHSRPLDPMSNFNSELMKNILVKDPIALDFYISP